MAPPWALLGIFVLSLLLVHPSPAASQKTDIVELNNGDQFTGELKHLQRAQVRLKTDALGDVSVHWLDIRTITSDKQLELELTDGTFLYGLLVSDDGRQIFVDGNGERSELDLRSVVWMTPMKDRFWSRFDGTVDLGLSFLRQNSQLDYTLGARARYNGYGSDLVFNLNSLLRTQGDSTTANRHDSSLRYSNYFAAKTFWTGLGSVESNAQLSLDVRGSLGAGLGRSFVQTNRWSLAAWAGAGLSRERFKGASGNTVGTGIASVVGEFFTEENLDTDVIVEATVLPGLDQGGRVRFEGSGAVHQEIFKNFFFKIRLFGSHDSKPPTAGTTNKTDWGLTTSLGWKF